MWIFRSCALRLWFISVCLHCCGLTWVAPLSTSACSGSKLLFSFHHSRPRGATECSGSNFIFWPFQTRAGPCSSWGPGVGRWLLLNHVDSHMQPWDSGHNRVSSSLIWANSLLSNLSVRRARMVALAPRPGSCSSEASCLMVVNTNCSVGARERPRREKITHKTTSQYTHSTHNTPVCHSPHCKCLCVCFCRWLKAFYYEM